MTCLSAVILGLIQGVAEFLPISSSGHLAFFQTFFGLASAEEDSLLFDVLLHLGTLVAVIFAYRKEIAAMLRELGILIGRRPASASDPSARRLLLLLIVATLPLVLVLPVKDQIEALYSNTFFIAAAFAVTGCLLFFSDRIRGGRKDEKTATLVDAIVVGLGQAAAVTPGLSRSGTTISMGLFCGYNRPFAVRFSFLLSIPAVLGANLLSLGKAIKTGVPVGHIPMYLLGMFVAGVTGYLAIRLIQYISHRGKFGGFAYYCWGAAIVTLVLSLIS